MSDIQTKIGKYDSAAKNVPVTFTKGEIVHNRHVNAVLTDAGKYDKAATEQRVAEVAAGVAAKIACGAIVNPPEPAAE